MTWVRSVAFSYRFSSGYHLIVYRRSRNNLFQSHKSCSHRVGSHRYPAFERLPTAYWPVGWVSWPNKDHNNFGEITLGVRMGSHDRRRYKVYCPQGLNWRNIGDGYLSDWYAVAVYLHTGNWLVVYCCSDNAHIRQNWSVKSWKDCDDRIIPIIMLCDGSLRSFPTLCIRIECWIKIFIQIVR